MASLRPGLAALTDEFALPLADAAVDRVLLVHALEMSHEADALLREVWRVLASGGRLLAVVPNRRGLWARMDTTPFGHGRPCSRSQIVQVLRETGSADPAGARRSTCRRLRAAGSCARRRPGAHRLDHLGAVREDVHIVEQASRSIAPFSGCSVSLSGAVGARADAGAPGG